MRWPAEARARRAAASPLEFCQDSAGFRQWSSVARGGADTLKCRDLGGRALGSGGASGMAHWGPAEAGVG